MIQEEAGRLGEGDFTLPATTTSGNRLHTFSILHTTLFWGSAGYSSINIFWKLKKMEEECYTHRPASGPACLNSMYNFILMSPLVMKLVFYQKAVFITYTLWILWQTNHFLR